MIRLLITCVGGELMPYLLKYIKTIDNPKVYIVGTDFNHNAVGRLLCDKFYTVPLGKDISYIEKIINLTKKEKINLVLPTSDEEALVLAKNKKLFNKNNINLACINYKELRILNNKQKTYTVLKEKGFNVAEWHNLASFEDFREKVEYYDKLYKKFIVKPKEGRGSRNIFIVSNENKKNKHLELNYLSKKELFNKIGKNKKLSEFIIMQKLNHPVVDIDLLGWRGKPLSVIPRQRINPLFPNMGHKILGDKKLITLGRKLIRSFNLSWLYDCDIMFNDKKEPVIIEINPRQSGSISVSIAAGYEIFKNLLKLHSKGKIIQEKKIHSLTIVPYKSLYIKK